MLNQVDQMSKVQQNVKGSEKPVLPTGSSRLGPFFLLSGATMATYGPTHPLAARGCCPRCPPVISRLRENQLRRVRGIGQIIPQAHAEVARYAKPDLRDHQGLGRISGCSRQFPDSRHSRIQGDRYSWWFARPSQGSPERGAQHCIYCRKNSNSNSN